ncbi:MAG: tetratricopeptide repeat protein [Candidatus Omnitrophota bacterium]
MNRKLIINRISLVIAGVLAALLLLETGLRLTGIAFLSFQEYENKKTVRYNKGYRILCLGDSLTTLGGRNSYPGHLQAILNQNTPDLKCSVINKGWIGATSEDIISKIEAYLKLYKPDMIVAMMGINDPKEPVLYTKDNKFRILVKSMRLYKLFTRLSNKTTLSIKRGQHDSETFYKNAINKHPEGSNAYLALSGFYWRHERFEEAELNIKKAVDMDPGNIRPWLLLAWFYSELERFQEAEDIFKKGIEAHPDSVELYMHRAAFYKEQGRFKEAEETLERVREIDKNISLTYIHLVSFDNDRERLKDAEIIFKDRISKQPLDDRLFGGLALCYEYMGRYEDADECFMKADSLRASYYNPVTWFNYQELAKIARSKGVKLICVQYPMRSLNSLLKMFVDADGIIFVDNEAIFKQAVRQKGYDEYFIDTFGGDFGHCTDRGNYLLARNIAKSISEYLKK